MKRIIVFLTALSLILSSFTVFGAPSLSEKKRELEEKIEQSEKQFASAKEKKLYYDAQIDDLQKNIDDFDLIINSLQSEIDGHTARINEINAQLEVKEESFAERLRALQHRGPMSYMDVLFGATSFSDLLMRISLIDDIVSHDKGIIDEISALKSEEVAAKDAIVAKQDEQKEAKGLIVSEQNRISSLASKQQALMNEITADKAAYQKEYEKAVAEMEAETRAAASSGAFGSGAYTGSGRMQWPVPAGGYVSCRFGYRTDPFPSNHTGMDIAIGMGNAIVAAESGKVTRVVNSNYGYGKYLIIDHGDGSSTLYAHCSKIYVQVGQKVARGEHIAAIGSTGLSTGPHLHFEVIIGGKKVNPEAYLY